MRMDFRAKIVTLLAKHLHTSKEEIDSLLTVPPHEEFGDYSLPCFTLGAAMSADSSDPKDIAEKIKEELKLLAFISKVETVGPYVNFFLNNRIVAEETLRRIFREKDDYGRQNIGKGKKIVIDFSSPNIAKPFGIGHLRSTVIGNSLYKIFASLGYTPIGVNHLGDWGTQFGKLIVAYKKWGKKSEQRKDPVKYLLHLYVRFHKEAQHDVALDDLARGEFKKLEEGNKESLKLWQFFRDISLREFQKMYHLLNVVFDSYHGEAFYNSMLDDTIKAVQRKGLATISEGALVVNLDAYGMPPLLLRKSDGTTTYHTRDLAAAFYRLNHYRPEKILYVVGTEQQLHFRQLFKVLELLGKHHEKFVHVNFGLFRFPEGKMSTRKGNIIFLEDVLDKAIALAASIIDEKNPKLRNKKAVARMVGVGAIIFADLSTDRIRDVEFDWNKMLSFEGETAPYIQYTHARACAILRKAQREKKVTVTSDVTFETFNVAEEVAVIKMLYQFPETIVTAAKSYKPHHIAHYVIQLAQAFNEFYHKCPIISDQRHIMNARLLLVDSVRQVLRNGLHLLGIEAPEEM
jgi:arginyl-tRNA synthetase